MLWRKIRPRLSAGRVQSVAVRLVVQRERERMAFLPVTYWDLVGTFCHRGRRGIRGGSGHGGRPAPFPRAAISIRPREPQRPNRVFLDEAGAASLVQQLRSGRMPRGRAGRPALHDPALSAVHHQHPAARGQPQTRLHGPTHHAIGPGVVRKRPHHLHAYRLDHPGGGGGAGRPGADRVAVRTGVSAGRATCTRPRSRTPRRPTRRSARPGIPSTSPRPSFPLSPDAFRLYDLIWKRTVASQMTEARGRRITISIDAGRGVSRSAARRSNSPATCGRTWKAPTIPRPSWPTGRRCFPP